MTPSLADLRKTPQVPPTRFVAWQPGCWVQYYDDTEAKDAAKALAARTFDVKVARRKQLQKCAVCFSLQAFDKARTKQELLCFRNLGVDVDLVSAAERFTLSSEQIEQRKQDYLTGCLFPFPLEPHWLVETKHGFHVIFRVQPLRQPALVREVLALELRLVRALQGDENAALLTQVFRVPGTLQFKGKPPAFLTRLLLDNAPKIPPYETGAVRAVLDAWEVFHHKQSMDTPSATKPPADAMRATLWRKGLAGIDQGQRNATAAALVGAILGRLPEDLWETAGFGGLKEWNARNVVALPERELRTVFLSIARREYAKRTRRQPSSPFHDAQS